MFSILARLPLWSTVALTVPLTASAWIVTVHLLAPPFRLRLRVRTRVGLASGALATPAYDIVRYGLVALASWSISPFAALPLFGRGLLGEGAPTAAAWAAGFAFHFANGCGFATGYTLLTRRPSIPTGIAFALGLESLMLLLYPHFLDIRSFGEFLTMSIVGHVAYGTVLGWSAGHMLRGRGNPLPVWSTSG